jgi:hypothetical protein
MVAAGEHGRLGCQALEFVDHESLLPFARRSRKVGYGTRFGRLCRLLCRHEFPIFPGLPIASGEKSIFCEGLASVAPALRKPGRWERGIKIRCLTTWLRPNAQVAATLPAKPGTRNKTPGRRGRYRG